MFHKELEKFLFFIMPLYYFFMQEHFYETQIKRSDLNV